MPNNTTWNDAVCPLPIPAGLTSVIEDIISGKDKLGSSFTRPASAKHVRSCGFCDVLILPCELANGHYYEAECLVTEEDKELRADFFKPHCCAGLQRWQQHLESPDEPEFIWGEEEE
jgi:hypothetical protein